MGKRGPKPTPTEVLERRGSWRAVARRKAERAKKRKLPKIPLPDVDVGDPLDFIGLIPGYDPYQDAEGCYFDDDAARRAMEFFHNELTHVKGEKARTPFILEPWEKAFIVNIFGWKRGDGDSPQPDDLRRYREVLIYVPRKNGKTAISAGILLYLLFEDDEPGAEIYGAANEYKQASLVFQHARGMLLNRGKKFHGKNCIFHGKQCTLYEGQTKSIQLEDDASFYRVIAADAYNAHGYNIHAAVIDELHNQKNRDLVDAIETSTGARRQPLIVHITTADFERPSICNEKHEYAKRVRDGIISDQSYLPVIYEADKDEDWTDEKVWIRVNPNLGVSLTWEYFRRQYKRAQDSVAFENTFKRLHLNMRTEQAVRWLPMDAWDVCGAAFDPKVLEGRPCYGGLDLAKTIDLTVCDFVFPPTEDDPRTYVLLLIWAPEDIATQRERSNRELFLNWSREGHIRLTPGNVTDYGFIRTDINEFATRHEVLQIAYDPYNASHLVQELQEDGFVMVECRQGAKTLSAPCKELERLIRSELLAHGGHPVLRWMASNISVKIDSNGNITPDRDKSTNKIDGIVGLIMGQSRAMLEEVDDSPGIAERGIYVL